MKSTSLALVSLSALLLGAVPAYADGFVAPTVGVTFGNDAGATFVDAVSDQDRQRVSVGVAVGFMSNGVFGVEEDFAYSPNFFGKGGPISKTGVATLMTNVLIGVPVGGQRGPGIRPYGSIGVGLIRRTVDASLPLTNFSTDNFGYNVGVGVMGYFADHIGLRAGVQYYRNFERTGSNAIGLDAGQFDYFRGSFGVLFRF